MRLATRSLYLITADTCSMLPLLFGWIASYAETFDDHLHLLDVYVLDAIFSTRGRLLR